MRTPTSGFFGFFLRREGGEEKDEERFYIDENVAGDQVRDYTKRRNFKFELSSADNFMAEFLNHFQAIKGVSSVSIHLCHQSQLFL